MYTGILISLVFVNILFGISSKQDETHTHGITVHINVLINSSVCVYSGQKGQNTFTSESKAYA